MKKLFALGNRYVEESDWKDMALLKFCLCAMGMIIGMQISEKNKKAVTAGAMVVFIATYIPLMRKLFKVACSH